MFVSYYYDRLFGATAGYFDVAGSTDTGLYALDAVSGSRRGQPRSYGGISEFDVQPFAWQYNPTTSHAAVAMTRITLQYTVYGKFNGASANYDGFGRSALDNDTLFLSMWMPLLEPRDLYRRYGWEGVYQ